MFKQQAGNRCVFWKANDQLQYIILILLAYPG